MSSPSMNATDKAVYQCMKSLNKPCSINCVQEKIGNNVGKLGIQKGLDNLVKLKYATVKEFGKQKIYALKPEGKGNPEKFQQELRTLDKQIEVEEKKVREKLDVLKLLEANKKEKVTRKSLPELQAIHSQLMNEIAGLKIKLEMKNQRNGEDQQLTAAEKKAIQKKYDLYVAAYKKRKKMCKDMIDTILEGYPGTKKKLIQDIGIETDEDVNFVFEQI